jgi:hypothetical protein
VELALSKPVSLGYRPRKWQARVHKERKRFSVLVLHRRAGKTVFSIWELLLGDPARGLKGALSTPDGRFAYVAPYYSQAKAVAWDVLKKACLAIPGTVVRESELKVELPNGATIRLFGADNANALRGLGFDGIVVDEVADIEPGVWGEVIRPALSDRIGWALFIGTAKGINLFSELYYRAVRDPDWYAVSLNVYETQALPASEIEAARREMSPSQFDAEMMCVFSAGGVDILIPAERVEEAGRRVLAEREYRWAGKALGVDPARFGDDATALIIRQGPVAFALAEYRGLDTMEVADLAISFAQEHSVDTTFVDEGGLGAGVVDRMRQLGHGPVAVNFGTRSPIAKYANTRARLWGEMAEWLKTGCIPDSLQLKTDLSAPTFKFDIQQRIVLESKADMKKRGMASPDRADALALTFYSPIPAREELDGISLPRRTDSHRCHGAEYEPFAVEES